MTQTYAPPAEATQATDAVFKVYGTISPMERAAIDELAEGLKVAVKFRAKGNSLLNTVPPFSHLNAVELIGRIGMLIVTRDGKDGQ